MAAGEEVKMYQYRKHIFWFQLWVVRPYLHVFFSRVFGSTNIQLLFELLKQPKENKGSTKIRVETFSQGFFNFSHFLEFLNFYESSKSSCIAEAAKGKQWKTFLQSMRQRIRIWVQLKKPCCEIICLQNYADTYAN